VHTGLLLVTVGTAGSGLTTTVVVATGLVQPFTVAVTLYCPAFAIDKFEIEQFCVDDVNPLGPLQLYTAFAINDADKFKLLPTQRGELLPATGDAGIVFTITFVVADELVQPFTVTVTE